jgi:hypothetical protein
LALKARSAARSVSLPLMFGVVLCPRED